ncbi:DUF559 domain-containing protein [Novosphingobium sp. ZN18A2]|uniref:endonuclease domain-containing protein n=1 Tax=Novosphingobium sp. ZN18A2 TaxID=3079861 RepID=UPI0030CBCEE0
MTERKTLSTRAPSDDAPSGLKKKGRGWQIDEKRLDVLHDRAREMRRHPTEAQAALNKALGEVDTGGYTFRRQDVIGSAIVDFACKPLMLVVELDGDEDAAYAPTRDKSLAEVGYQVLRLPAAEVLADPEGAAAHIRDAMEARWHERRARQNTRPSRGRAHNPRDARPARTHQD